MSLKTFMIAGTCLLISFPSDRVSAFSPFDQSVRGLGSAGAYRSIADDSSGFFANPAGLSRQAENRLLYAQGGVQEDYDHWTFGTSIIDAKTEDPLHWGFLFSTVRTATVERDLYAIATSLSLIDSIFFGATSKIVNYNRSSLTREEWVYLMDFGLLAFLGDNIAIGASIQNPVRTSLNHDVHPVVVGGGISLNLKRLRLAADLSRNISKEAWELAMTAELEMFRGLIMRSGYFRTFKSGDEEESGITGGATVRVSNRVQMELGMVSQLRSNFDFYSTGVSIRL